MIAAVAQRLRTQVPAFKKVGGAVNLERALAGLTIQPAAFVLPLAKSASKDEFEDGSMNVIQQRVDALIGVVICVQSLVDAQGEEALEAKDPFEDAIDAALMGWSPDGNVFDPFTYSGGQLIGFRDQMLFWQSDYVTTYTKRVIT